MEPAPTPNADPAAPDRVVTGRVVTGRFVTVHAAGLRLAVPMAEIAEIVRPSELVPVPLAPASLLGLARRRGVALPVIGLARLLGLPGADDARAARLVIVRHLGQPVALAVDGLAGTIDAPPGRVTPVATAGNGGVNVGGGPDGDATAVDPALLLGMLQPGDGTEAVPVLDTAAAIERDFRELGRAAPVAAVTGPATTTNTPADTAAPAAGSDLRRLVCFEVAGQEFALPVERVREVVPLAGSVTRVPRAKPHLLGVATLRGGLLPLVGLRELFALDGGAAQQRPRVVVVRAGHGAAPVGVVVDAVREILRVESGLIGAVPPLLARDTAFEDMDGIARLDGGRRLVSVLSAERLFRHGAVLAGDGAAEEDAMTDRGARPKEGATETHLVVRMAGAEYALSIGTVQEVLRPPASLTPLPGAPDFVDGIMTVRGAVLPVVSPRRLLRLSGGAAGDRPRIVTVALGESRIGLRVDGVAGILGIPAAAIEPAPVLSSAQARLIGRVAALDGRQRTVLLLDTAQLLDLDGLAALVAATPEPALDPALDPGAEPEAVDAA